LFLAFRSCSSRTSGGGGIRRHRTVLLLLLLLPAAWVCRGKESMHRRHLALMHRVL